METTSRRFIINTCTDWREPPRARHQVAHALAVNHEVVFISANRLGFPGLRTLRVSENLDVILPRFPVDPRIRIRIPFINKLYQNWLFKNLKERYGDYVVINFDFTANNIFDYFQHVIYYCNDDHSGLSYVLNMLWIAKYQDLCERTVAKRSDFCIATSGFLLEKIKKLNPKTFEIRLGAPTINNAEMVFRERTKGRINVGFVGFLETIDNRIIADILRHEELNFTMIGPFKTKHIKNVITFKNVRFTGAITGADLHKEVGNFHVGIIPYNIKSSIDRTPNKLWLYLALGIPVVISNIKGIRDWSFPEKFVYLADNMDEFMENIKKAYQEDNESLASARIEFARANSWEMRMQELIKIYENNTTHV